MMKRARSPLCRLYDEDLSARAPLALSLQPLSSGLCMVALLRLTLQVEEVVGMIEANLGPLGACVRACVHVRGGPSLPLARLLARTPLTGLRLLHSTRQAVSQTALFRAVLRVCLLSWAFVRFAPRHHRTLQRTASSTLRWCAYGSSFKNTKRLHTHTH